MEPMNNWEPVAVDGKQEITSHREPGEEFMFYRSVAAGLIDAVQDNCSRGAFENMEGAGKLSDNPVTNLLAKPGLWMQNFTTFEPDDSMIEVAIEALKRVIPAERGKDQW